MLGRIADQVTGALGQRFVLALVMPVLTFSLGTGSLTVTLLGWGPALAWWARLGGSRQALLGIAFALGVIFAATLLGTQLIPLTRLLEGYWGSGPITRPIRTAAMHHQRFTRDRLRDRPRSEADFMRSYQYFPWTDELLPTRLGNVLRASENYSGDGERWALNAVFWWPRLWLVLPEDARKQVDSARATLDQMVVITWLAALFGLTAAGFGAAGLSLTVWLPCTAGSLLLAWLSYQAAVAAGVSFGELVRSCYDLYRRQLLDSLGWDMPPRWADERALWQQLQQQLYRRGTSGPGRGPGLTSRPRRNAGWQHRASRSGRWPRP